MSDMGLSAIGWSREKPEVGACEGVEGAAARGGVGCGAVGRSNGVGALCGVSGLGSASGLGSVTWADRPASLSSCDMRSPSRWRSAPASRSSLLAWASSERKSGCSSSAARAPASTGLSSASAEPHLVQKEWVSGFTCWQLGQVISFNACPRFWIQGHSRTVTPRLLRDSN